MRFQKVIFCLSRSESLLHGELYQVMSAVDEDSQVKIIGEVRNINLVVCPRALRFWKEEDSD